MAASVLAQSVKVPPFEAAQVLLALNWGQGFERRLRLPKVALEPRLMGQVEACRVEVAACRGGILLGQLLGDMELVSLCLCGEPLMLFGVLRLAGLVSHPGADANP